ncbi:hypothetical protein E3P92_01916 [Wallemia ichthyophaga]|uniref:Cytoplasmic tRNA 2-thiolation protein 1 n=1 Tax=Wallemia ichthyophaga TaxID=245174 RepID=A0A4T0FS50_WALIC|nr:hypothetical protein E3P91_01773 [Wallemia ichthyophaga]TIA82063.1 hypothetical protein E3P98_01687 [Wallemia ichthyophaga]TIA91502.1 hypothetical protein E3P97_01991 [Wallemia ichthyophaga]TIB00438.1 hypothetical protein E3P95_01702 [Wallemia ichthyophaga]TIB01629.1 hypothetical protein E3P94_01737 [Wallemia ichthyophaga]
MIKRPKTGQQVCKECFFFAFEEEIHKTISDANTFKRGERVAIGASGGKDSTVLAHVMKTLNERHDYGLELFLLSIDEGITGYRDDSLETVKRNKEQYQLPLKILSYNELYGWTMDRIVEAVGKKNNCTFCGVFRRQALDRGASSLNISHIVTGHNADDVAETVLMNILRGDVSRLGRCVEITTRGEDTINRSKPFKYTYEKEIVMYAYFKKLDYFSTECIYSPEAYRGFARTYIKDLEALRPSTIIDIIHSAENIRISEVVQDALPKQQKCQRCGYISSNELCKACVLLQGLEKGTAKMAIGSKAKHVSQEVSSDTRTIPMFKMPDQQINCEECGLVENGAAYENLNIETRSHPNAFPSALHLKKSLVVNTLADGAKATGAEIDEKCPSCGHDKATFQTLQLRSADEGNLIN